ncbi:uncharacterized protein TRIVIDRAFT_217658 [Trichoderma virens Gv29-8]|uniref:Zn(2)-C6 fungal-type domain-containing protein n=1 Tax=Hypocrea virens (strain Gv29-8 / FGSC 10586) TaxID=413071 RepID=G9MF90_HYPVG|nr:uncharacterized protein TRIVIDRAFT_217658 [Trichoderma virens Gv29-8]EHK27056.1 hypothetical protein TRIVIDRAFT_217658 [Trichoderma virens Gv29-8]
MPSDGNFGVFALSKTSENPIFATPQVDGLGREPRQRKRHAKSRAGCLSCKSSRVKCDEVRPSCARCSARNIPCQYEFGIMAMLPKFSRQQINSQRLGVGSVPKTLGLGLDLSSLQLMYHFDHCTAPTLAFGSLNEVVMHAILMISASHQRSLWPDNAEHNKSLAYHLDLTLSGFRDLLSQGTDGFNHDIIIACAMLLVHYAWSMPFFAYGDEKIHLEGEPDRLLKFAAGLKTVMKTMKEDKRYTSGIFKAPMSYDSIDEFQQFEASLGDTFVFDDVFFSARTMALSGMDGCCIGGESFNACDRLTPLLRTMHAVSKGRVIHHLLPQIQVYTLFWPAKASKDFEEDVAENQTEALVIMLCFYATAWRLLSEDVWWAKTRTKVMCESIYEYLDKNRDPKWEADIENIRRYFGFSPNGNGGWAIGSPGAHFSE